MNIGLTAWIVIIGVLAGIVLAYILVSTPAEQVGEGQMNPDRIGSVKNDAQLMNNNEAASQAGEFIVYGSVLSDAEIEQAKADCISKGGNFNTCGSPCGPQTQVCIEVCAYTCSISGGF